MFFLEQTAKQKKEYEDFLKIAWSLSNLFSESTTPYLYYRVAEWVFCRAFGAEDLSRSDVSADAKKGTLWIGLKTFLIGNTNSFQKVAEFNSDKGLYSALTPQKMAIKIAELRNERIDFTKRAHGMDSAMYHCVVRDTGKFMIYEESMDLVKIENLRNVKLNKSSLIFDDGINEYSFLLSKNTLTKRFKTTPIIYDFDVKMLEDPLLELKGFINSLELWVGENKIIGTIFLPLYGKNNTVFEKSGLNQWNAGGRDRNPNEVYIPIPAEIHRQHPGFLPDRDTPFNLKLPNWRIMKSKVCQDGSKALMSYSNRELGEWILRDVLNLEEGELLTYKKLQTVWIDSVRIDKLSDWTFEINFANSGSYENFIENEDN